MVGMVVGERVAYVVPGSVLIDELDAQRQYVVIGTLALLIVKIYNVLKCIVYCFMLAGQRPRRGRCPYYSISMP